MKGRNASGRVEKIKKYHAAAGESGFHVRLWL